MEDPFGGNDSPDESRSPSPVPRGTIVQHAVREYDTGKGGSALMMIGVGFLFLVLANYLD